MPLRDHFRPPLDDLASWDGFHGQWPAMIVIDLAGRLPDGFVAAPRIYLGSSIEVDIATFATDRLPRGDLNDVGGAMATWAAPVPTLALAIDRAAQGEDEYEVRIYDARRGRRLVAAIELVSPANKDRPENRHAFVAKCVALLREQVCVTIVDVVTNRSANLYEGLIDWFGLADPAMAAGPQSLYAVTCRRVRQAEGGRLEVWTGPVTIGEALPTLPVWLDADRAIPLDLEVSYEATRKVLHIP